MIIKTDEVVIKNRDNITQQIANFWDQISEAWRMVWGEHIHHGYYVEGEDLSPKQAQERLIEELCQLLRVKVGDKILDVGCGMGGSSLFLNEKYHADITGITLSPRQVAIASKSAQKRQLKNIDFRVEDALSMTSLQDNTFDIVWALESCEQMYDKALFVQQAFRVLKPGGKLMLATWCSDRDTYEGKEANDYKKLCLAFDLPYMPTIERYNEILLAQDFKVISKQNWAAQVAKSWDVGISLMNAFSLFRILRMAGLRGLHFAYQVKLMQAAFHKNRIHYGVFVAVKP